MTKDAKRFKDKVKALPPLPKAVWPHWDFWRMKLREDIAGGDPNEMLKWHTIRHTMMVNHLPIIGSWKLVGKNLERYREAIRPTKIEEPIQGIFGDYSRNMIEQCANIAVWENECGTNIEDLNTIFEFGGGYGAMALATRRLGFQGTYIIYDYPEMTYMQEFFLSRHGESVVHLTDLPDIVEADMLIAIHSISETHPPFRNDFFERVDTENVIMRYTPRWMGIDNVAYFEKIAEDKRYKYAHFKWEGWDSYMLAGCKR